jgi:hypothetical protein
MTSRCGLAFAVSVVLSLSCGSSKPTSDDIRAPRPGDGVPSNASHVFSVHRGGDLCAGSVIVRTVEYNFDVECGHNTIVYVQTLDPHFVAPEGVKIRDSLRAAVSRGGTLLATEECGVKLPSGWIARPPMGAVTRGSSRTSCAELLDEEIAYFDM